MCLQIYGIIDEVKQCRLNLSDNLCHGHVFFNKREKCPDFYLSKILLEDASAMIFLLILVCYVDHTAKYLTYLLTLRYVSKFDNLHMTQCAKIIVGFTANVGNVFVKR